MKKKKKPERKTPYVLLDAEELAERRYAKQKKELQTYVLAVKGN